MEENDAMAEDFAEGWEDETGGLVNDGRETEEVPEMPPDEPAAEEPEEAASEEPVEPEPPIAPPEARAVDPAARDRDFRHFLEEFPTVNARDVPKEVWERVNAGESLTTAYMRYEARTLREENRKLRETIKAEERERENRRRSAGSQRSAGAGDGRRDPFEMGWNDV